MKTEQEIREHLAKLQALYDQAASPTDGERKPAHLVVLSRSIRDKMDVLNWVLDEAKPGAGGK